MHETIQQLLILQDNDRKISRTRSDLDNVGLHRHRLEQRLADAHRQLEASKTKARQLESERHDLEVEVDSKNQQIAKYSQQQFQTKKNEEYQALTHEIDNCKKQVSRLEDRQLELMEQIDAEHKKIEQAEATYQEAKQQVEGEQQELDERTEYLNRQLEEYEGKREELKTPIDANTLRRYERIQQNRGVNSIVPIDRGICGGCHMKLPPQVMVSCKAEKELTTCPNCSRILYHSREMETPKASE